MFSSANTGILHEDLPMLEFVPGTSVVVTKENDLIATVRAQGIDPECLPEEAIEKKSERILEAILQFDPHYRVTKTLISSPIPAPDFLTEYPNAAVSDLAVRTKNHLAQKRLFQKELYLSFLLKEPLAKKMVASFDVLKLQKNTRRPKANVRNNY